jgi:HEAT repeat protein
VLPTLVAVALAALTQERAAPVCPSVPACISRLRTVAREDLGPGIGPDENAVAMALQALSPESIEPVVSLLEDPEVGVRELAGYVLRGMPGLQPRHLPALRAAVEAGDGWLPPAIASIGTPEAVRFLVAQLAKRPQSQTQLTVALERLGTRAVPGLVELFHCGESCDARLLLVAGQVLGEMDDAASAAVAPLASIAGDPGASFPERNAAVRALGSIGALARPAIQTVLALAREGPAPLKDAARMATLEIGGPGTRDVLESFLDRESPSLALIKIARLGAGGREAGPRIETLLDSPDRDARVASARALGAVGYTPAAPRLTAALADRDDWRLVYCAAEALGRLGAAESRGALRQTAASHWYPPVREAAATAALALDGRSVYEPGSRPADLSIALDTAPGVVRLGPCADARHYPAVPERSEVLDPSRAELAKRLAYDRVVEGFDEKGRHTRLRPTVPTVGVRVAGGWLVGNDAGEWGGELVYKSDAGATAVLLSANVHALHALSEGRVVASTGLAHMGFNDGSLYAVSCRAEGCSARRWKELPGAPVSSWMTASGELLVNARRGSLLIAPDGTMRMAECPADAPAASPGPRSGAPLPPASGRP